MGAIEELRRILAGLDGPATRERLRHERSRIERSFQEESPASAQDDAHDAILQEEEKLDQTAQAPAGSRFAAAHGDGDAAVPISILLLTPNREHATKLEKNYAAEPECLRLGTDVADNAILIAVANMRNLLAVIRNAEWWKFKRCHGLYLLSTPEDPNVADAEVMAIYIRGGLKPSAAVKAWQDDNDPVRLANRLLQGIDGRRVHLFANARNQGWEAVVGDENWATGDCAK
jgi:hypothetical protein